MVQHSPANGQAKQLDRQITAVQLDLLICCVYVLRPEFQTNIAASWASPVAFTVFACQQGAKLKLP
jgi:hypothetical protein